MTNRGVLRCVLTIRILSYDVKQENWNNDLISVNVISASFYIYIHAAVVVILHIKDKAK